MNTVKALFKLEWKKLLRTPIILGFGIVAPLFFLVVQSEITSNQISLYGVDVSPVDYSFPMFAFMSIVVLAIGNVGIGLSYTRGIKFFKRLKLASVKSIQYITANLFVQLICATLTIIILTIVAMTRYGVSLEGRNILLFISMLIISFAMCYFIGVFIGNATTDPKSSQSISMIVYFIIIFLGGVTYPLEIMPKFMQNIALLLPTTHAVKILQLAWNGGTLFEGIHFIYVIATTIIFGILSIKFFKYE